MPRKSDSAKGRHGRRGRHGGARRRSAAQSFTETLQTTVTALAAQGDGVAEAPDGRRLFIPLTLPGDVVEVAVGPARGDGFEARVEKFIEQAPREPAFCPYFQACGGCSVQHVPIADYREWKRDILVQALSRRGLTPEVLDLATVPNDTRRRVTFQVERRGGNKILLGFKERRENRIVDIASCPLLVPELNALVPSLRELAAKMLQPTETARMALARVVGPDGPALDLVVERDREPDLATREALADFAQTSGAARISWRGADGAVEPVAHIASVAASFEPAVVELPPGGFMQPTAEGEEILRDAVVAGAKGAERIAELYSGAGTFTMALAKIAHVYAVDGDPALSRALSTGAGRSRMGGRVTVETRDLAARPLLPGELEGFDTVVLDPPRAGALRQVEQIVATPGVRRVVMVSCNPQTFARDMRILVTAGFKPGPVLPVDQFPYSHHLECVTTLIRGF
mgnify:CR=1 FL=1